ncbi:N-acetyltransferase 5 [Blastocladiella emersonii ATCC 22665]|nr:N-acetyltransferase 5 [Blastocladiella emersonii ATCC 22665]
MLAESHPPLSPVPPLRPPEPPIGVSDDGVREGSASLPRATPSFSPSPSPSLSPLPSPRKPREPEFREIDESLIPALRYLNAALYPVSYNDHFYRDVLRNRHYAWAALVHERLVGAICCRCEYATDGLSYRLYVMTLGVLSPFRRLGIASRLLRTIVERARDDPDCEEVFLHVHTANTGALEFYDRFGFIRRALLPTYYIQLNPSSAYILALPLLGPLPNDASTEREGRVETPFPTSSSPGELDSDAGTLTPPTRSDTPELASGHGDGGDDCPLSSVSSPASDTDAEESDNYD